MFNKFGIVIIVLLASKFWVLGQKAWTFDLYDIKVINRTPDIILFDLHLLKVSRGVYAIDGFIDFLQDFDDSLFCQVDLYHSNTGGMNAMYIKLALAIARQPITEIMNNFYKRLLMESMQNCTENGIYFEGDFVPPLTKRRLKMNKCMLSAENMPDKLATGYYKVVLITSGAGNSEVQIYDHVYST